MGHRKHKHSRLRQQVTQNPVASCTIAELPVMHRQVPNNVNDTGCLKLLGLFFVCYFIFAIGIFMIVDADRDVIMGTVQITSVERLDNGSTRLGYGENRTLTTTDNIVVEVGEQLNVYYKERILGGIDIIGVQETKR